MSLFGNVPPDALVDAVEKHVSTLDDDHLAALLRGGLNSMPQQTTGALVQSIFDAFRDRGESSEDAAEGAETSVAAIESHDPAALDALISYARANPGLLEHALIAFAEEHKDQMTGLPSDLVDGIASAL
jgi:hypothetical protein